MSQYKAQVVIYTTCTHGTPTQDYLCYINLIIAFAPDLLDCKTSSTAVDNYIQYTHENHAYIHIHVHVIDNLHLSVVMDMHE